MHDLATSKKGTKNKSTIMRGRNVWYTLLLTSAYSQNHPNSEIMQKEQKDPGNGTKDQPQVGSSVHTSKTQQITILQLGWT